MADLKSNVFQVTAGRARTLHAVGLVDGEELQVRYAIDMGCKPTLAQYSDYYEDGCPVMLDIQHNPITLWRPGYYRLEFDLPVSPDVKIVVSDPYPVTLGQVNNVGKCCGCGQTTTPPSTDIHVVPGHSR